MGDPPDNWALGDTLVDDKGGSDSQTNQKVISGPKSKVQDEQDELPQDSEMTNITTRKRMKPQWHKDYRM